MKKRILGVLGAVVAVVAMMSVPQAEVRAAGPCDSLADGSTTKLRCLEEYNNCISNIPIGAAISESEACAERAARKYGGSSSGGSNSGSNSGSTGGTTTTTSGGDGTTRANMNKTPMDTECTDGVKTNFFGGCVSGEGGEGIFRILAVALNVLTFGIGIAATIGFVIAGIQYITARDNASQIEKAKMRMLQIVIGLVMYAMIWALLEWLIPGGVLNTIN